MSNSFFNPEKILRKVASLQGVPLEPVDKAIDSTNVESILSGLDNEYPGVAIKLRDALSNKVIAERDIALYVLPSLTRKFSPVHTIIQDHAGITAEQQVSRIGALVDRLKQKVPVIPTSADVANAIGAQYQRLESRVKELRDSGKRNIDAAVDTTVGNSGIQSRFDKDVANLRRRGESDSDIIAGRNMRDAYANPLKEKTLGTVRHWLATQGSLSQYVYAAKHQAHMDSVTRARVATYRNPPGPVYEYNGSGGIIIPESAPVALTPEEVRQFDSWRVVLNRFGMASTDVDAFFIAVKKNENRRTPADIDLLQKGYIILGKATLKPDELTALQGAVDDAFLTQKQFDAFMLLRSGVKKLSFFNFRDADTIGKAANFIYKLAPLSEKIRTVNTEAVLFGKDGAWLERYRKAVSQKALGKFRVDEKILREGEGFIRVAPLLAGWYETQAPGCAPVLRTAINAGQISIDDVVKFANGKSGVLNKRKNRIEAVLIKFKKDTEARTAETARMNEGADSLADTLFPVAQLPAGDVFRNPERRREYARILKSIFETQGGEHVVTERLVAADETVYGFATTFGQSLGTSFGNKALQLWRIAELAKRSGGGTAELERVATEYENISIGMQITAKYKTDPESVRGIIGLLTSKNKTPAGVSAISVARRYLEAGEFSKPSMLGKNIKIAFTTLG